MKKIILGIITISLSAMLVCQVSAASSKKKTAKPTLASIKITQQKNEKAIGYTASYAVSSMQVENLIKKLAVYCPKSSQDQSLITALIDQRQRSTINLFLTSAQNSKSLAGYCSGKMTAYRLSVAMINRSISKKYFDQQNQKTPLEIYNQFMSKYATNQRIETDFTSKPQFSLFNGGAGRSDTQKALLEPSKQLFVAIYNDMLTKLVSDKIIESGEVPGILAKTRVEFTNRCDFIHGLTEVEITTKYPDNISTTGLSFIQYNVNVCDDASYMSELDKHLQSLIIHELGHYHYYIKNNQVKLFDKICWDITPTSMINKCTRSDFVSDYAMGNNEEDYAETFQFWYLNKFPISGSTKLLDKKAQFEPFRK